MVRTQIYLSRTEHTFLLTEAGRRNIPVAALIRGFIDEKMEIPKDAWANNPMLQDLDDDSFRAGRRRDQSRSLRLRLTQTL